MRSNNWGRIKRLERYAERFGVSVDEEELQEAKLCVLRDFVNTNSLGYRVLKSEESYVQRINECTYDVPIIGSVAARSGKEEYLHTTVSSMNALGLKTFVNFPVRKKDLSKVRSLAQYADDFFRKSCQRGKRINFKS